MNVDQKSIEKEFSIAICRHTVWQKSLETKFSIAICGHTVWRQMAIKNSISKDFLSTFLDSIGVFDCPLPRVSQLTHISSNAVRENLLGSSRRWVTKAFCADLKNGVESEAKKEMRI